MHEGGIAFQVPFVRFRGSGRVGLKAGRSSIPLCEFGGMGLVGGVSQPKDEPKSGLPKQSLFREK